MCETHFCRTPPRLTLTGGNGKRQKADSAEGRGEGCAWCCCVPVGLTLLREEVRNRKLLGLWAWPGGGDVFGEEGTSDTNSEVSGTENQMRKSLRGTKICLQDQTFIFINNKTCEYCTFGSTTKKESFLNAVFIPGLVECHGIIQP